MQYCGKAYYSIVSEWEVLAEAFPVIEGPVIQSVYIFRSDCYYVCDTEYLRWVGAEMITLAIHFITVSWHVLVF